MYPQDSTEAHRQPQDYIQDAQGVDPEHILSCGQVEEKQASHQE